MQSALLSTGEASAKVVRTQQKHEAAGGDQNSEALKKRAVRKKSCRIKSDRKMGKRLKNMKFCSKENNGNLLSTFIMEDEK